MIKIFEKDGKINFVDDENTLVGFDYHQSCCEDFGWFMTKEEPTTINIDTKDKIDHENLDLSEYLSEYLFDKGYFKMDSVTGYDQHNYVLFRLKKNEEVIYLMLYNCHNGYYGHGFNMDIGGKTIYSNVL